MTTKAEHAAMCAAADAHQNANAYAWQALQCGDTVSEQARRQRCMEISRAYTLAARHYRAEAETAERCRSGRPTYEQDDEKIRVRQLIGALPERARYYAGIDHLAPTPLTGVAT